ncbi:MAG TPA: hypothetical protein VHW46_15510 [Terracidiphilus sp.]|jgi:ATP-dependent DNA ligase|nr:hypothetical protein [Terracidiphilus sp.]
MSPVDWRGHSDTCIVSAHSNEGRIRKNLATEPSTFPRLATRIEKLPIGPAWIYEPKWDRFRTLIFRDGKEILLQSPDQKSLNRYFPELLEPLLDQLPRKCVVDGEIVISVSREPVSME